MSFAFDFFLELSCYVRGWRGAFPIFGFGGGLLVVFALWFGFSVAGLLYMIGFDVKSFFWGLMVRWCSAV